MIDAYCRIAVEAARLRARRAADREYRERLDELLAAQDEDRRPTEPCGPPEEEDP